MSVLNLQAIVKNDDFHRLMKALEPKSILETIGTRFMSFVDESFRTSGRGRWKPLRPGTIEGRKHGGNKPLQDRGAAGYKGSFVPETDGRTYVEVGTNLKTPDGKHSLGKIHERGAGPFTVHVRNARVLAARRRDGGWSFFGKEVTITIPPRPVLPTRQEGEKLVQETVDGMLQRAIDGRR